MTRPKKIVAAVLLPAALALHAYLLWLGGPWRIFALVEAGVAIILALLVRDLKKMEISESKRADIEQRRQAADDL